jgi:hypothetical protein
MAALSLGVMLIWKKMARMRPPALVQPKYGLLSAATEMMIASGPTKSVPQHHSIPLPLDAMLATVAWSSCPSSPALSIPAFSRPAMKSVQVVLFRIRNSSVSRNNFGMPTQPSRIFASSSITFKPACMTPNGLVTVPSSSWRWLSYLVDVHLSALVHIAPNQPSGHSSAFEAKYDVKNGTPKVDHIPIG